MNKKNKCKSIQRLLLERFFVILFSLLVILCIYQFKSMKNYILKNKAEDLNARILNVEENIYLKSNSINSIEDYKETLASKIKTEEIAVLIIDQSGKVILSEQANYDNSDVQLDKDEYLQILNDNTHNGGYKIINVDHSQDIIAVWRIIQIKNQDGNINKSIIQINAATQTSKQIMNDSLKMFVIATSFIVFVGAILAYTVSKYTLKPLNEITQSIDSLDTNNIKDRININYNQKEIIILKNSFNNILDKIQKSYEAEEKVNESMKVFVMDASHELRTPLTGIKGFIEVLQLGAKDNSQKLDMALSNMSIEVERLVKLVNNLILITKIDGNIYYEVKRENLYNIVLEIEQQLHILAKARTINFDIDKDIYLEINKDHVKQIIYNLVQNAINHTSDDGQISVIINKINSSQIQIAIKDNGEGISKENINKIFDRFFRSKEDRARKKHGYGLGLAIVKSIVERYDGHIEVESELNKGTCFRIIFHTKINR